MFVWELAGNVLMGCLTGFCIGVVMALISLAYFLFTLAQEEVHRRQVELIEKAIELERLRSPDGDAGDPDADCPGDTGGQSQEVLGDTAEGEGDFGHDVPAGQAQ